MWSHRKCWPDPDPDRIAVGQAHEQNNACLFRHENQGCPPSMSEGNLRLDAKSDLMPCLEDISNAKSDAPTATCMVLDGAAVVQMLKQSAT